MHKKEVITMATYSLEHINTKVPAKLAIQQKMTILKDFGFVNKANEAAVKAWLSKFTTEAEMTRALHPVMRFEKKLSEVMG
jgi:hypothetical protein